MVEAPAEVVEVQGSQKAAPVSEPKGEPPVEPDTVIAKKAEELQGSVAEKTQVEEAPVKQLYDKFQNIELEQLDEQELGDFAEEAPKESIHKPAPSKRSENKSKGSGKNLEQYNLDLQGVSSPALLDRGPGLPGPSDVIPQPPSDFISPVKPGQKRLERGSNASRLQKQESQTQLNLRLMRSKDPRKPRVPIFKKPATLTGPTTPLPQPSFKQLMKMKREEQNLPTRLRQMHAKQLNQAEMQNQKLRYQLQQLQAKAELAARTHGQSRSHLSPPRLRSHSPQRTINPNKEALMPNLEPVVDEETILQEQLVQLDEQIAMKKTEMEKVRRRHDKLQAQVADLEEYQRQQKYKEKKLTALIMLSNSKIRKLEDANKKLNSIVNRQTNQFARMERRHQQAGSIGGSNQTGPKILRSKPEVPRLPLNVNADGDDLDAEALTNAAPEKRPHPLKIEDYGISKELQLEGFEDNPSSAATLEQISRLQDEIMQYKDKIAKKEEGVQRVTEKKDRTEQLWLKAHRKHKALLQAQRDADVKLKSSLQKDALGDSEGRAVDLLISSAEQERPDNNLSPSSARLAQIYEVDTQEERLGLQQSQPSNELSQAREEEPTFRGSPRQLPAKRTPAKSRSAQPSRKKPPTAPTPKLLDRKPLLVKTLKRPQTRQHIAFGKLIRPKSNDGALRLPAIGADSPRASPPTAQQTLAQKITKLRAHIEIVQRARLSTKQSQ